MVVLVRYSLLALALGGAALLLVCFGLTSRSFLATPSPKAAAALVLFLGSAALCLLLAVRIFRFRDPQREGNLAAGFLLAAVTSLVCIVCLELALGRLRPALTYERAVGFSPPVFRPSPILPYELKPGYHQPTYMWEAGATIDFRVNPQGTRGPAFSVRKPPGTYRILVLGDSFAINAAVPEESLFTILLESMLDHSEAVRCSVEIINAGWANGYSPDAYVAYMLNKGFDLGADLVIMQYFVLNDFKDLLETEVLESYDGKPVRVRSRYRYIDELGRLRRSTAWQYEVPVLRDSHLFIHLWNLLRLNRLNRELVPILIPNFGGDNFLPNSYGVGPEDVYADARERPPVLQEAFERSLEYIRQLHEEAQERGVEFLLFVVPDGAQTSREIWQKSFAFPPPANWDDPNPQVQIRAALASDGITVLDPLASYRERVKQEVLFLGPDQNGHWNAAGNAHTARILFDYLTQRFEPFRSACRVEPRTADDASADGGAS